MTRTPDFVIVGAQKAASSWLLECLRQHPDIWTPAGETHYFRQQDFQRSDANFLAHLGMRAGEAARFGVKCPDYLADVMAPQAVVATCGPVDAIALLREPISRAVSSWYWAAQFGRVPVLDHEVGLRGLLGGGFGKAWPKAHEPLTWGLYGEHLMRWAKAVGSDRLHVILDTDLRADPLGVLRRTYEALGVDPAVEPANAGRTTNAGIYDLRRLRWLNFRARWLYTWDDDRRLVTMQRARRGSAALGSAAVWATDRLILSRLFGNAKPLVSDELRDLLTHYYAEDTRVLTNLLGRSLLDWTTFAGRAAGSTSVERCSVR